MSPDAIKKGEALLDQVLRGLRVVDLTQNVAGPYCTQILGDLGAEVIKIERPGRGDDTRDWRPPEIGAQSATFLALNRNKRSICLNLDSEDGIAVLHSLVKTADIFIHSMKPGSPEARRFGFKDFEATNPRLIYCAISAFGASGPLSHLPGYDPLMQAFTGIMSTTGREGDEPVRVGVSLIDMGTGVWSALGIVAAVLDRSRSGKGALVETSLLETGVTWMTVFIAGFLATSRLPKKLGSAMTMTAPYEIFQSSDGHVFIAAGNDALFKRVCEGIGQAELAADVRFCSNPARVAHRQELHQAIEALTSLRTTKDIVASLRGAGAPCSEMHDVSQMLSHEQVVAMDLVKDLPVSDAPHHRAVALPIKVNSERSNSWQRPPALGENTDGILLELGYEPEELSRLRTAGVVA